VISKSENQKYLLQTLISSDVHDSSLGLGSSLFGSWKVRLVVLEPGGAWARALIVKKIIKIFMTTLNLQGWMHVRNPLLLQNG
jgi:hypothetical protein